jgi:protein-disulfide isomerase
MQVGYDPARVRGNPKAPVMIVEFSDFQCPYCHQVEPVVKECRNKHLSSSEFLTRSPQ